MVFTRLQRVLVLVTGEYENLAKDKSVWGPGLPEEDLLPITDGNDGTNILINPGVGWTFIAVDLEVQSIIGYIRVLMGVGKFIALHVT